VKQNQINEKKFISYPPRRIFCVYSSRVGFAHFERGFFNIMNIHERLLAKFGDDNQKLKAIEEMAELIQAIIKGTNVSEELADVQIMLDQLKIIYPQWKSWEQIKINHIEQNIL